MEARKLISGKSIFHYRKILYFVLLFFSAPLKAQGPDLAVTDIWAVGGQIHYQIKNIGHGPAAPGHETALYIENIKVATQTVSVSIAAGARYNSFFSEYSWQCSEQTDLVKVSADYKNIITEPDEINNKREETWKCDSVPPLITSGPTVSGITQSSANISWTTNEPSDSTVAYSRYAGQYEKELNIAAPVTSHLVTLSSLNAGTNYHFVVRSTDSSGNTVESSDKYFQTNPASDTVAPQVTMVTTVNSNLPIQFSADANDNRGVDRVKFKMAADGKLILTDFTSPFNCLLNPAFMEYEAHQFYGNHTIIAEALDAANNSNTQMAQASIDFATTDIDIEILIGQWWRIYTDGDTAAPQDVEIEVDASEPGGFTLIDLPENPWGRHGLIIPQTRPVAEVVLYLDGVEIGRSSEQVKLHSFPYNVGGLTVGDHTLRARAESHEGGYTSTTATMRVERRMPNLHITRSISRSSTYFNVTCTINNNGQADAWLVHATDTLTGLQATRISESSDYTSSTDYDPDERVCYVDVQFNEPVIVSSHGSYSFTYKAVPILYPGVEDYHIGQSGAYVEYRAEAGGSILREEAISESMWVGTVQVDDSIAEALHNSDYLMVTCPQNLFNYYDDIDVNNLLNKMAELATHRGAVFGYYYSYGLVKTAASNGDKIAVGDIFDDWGAELFLADHDKDLIKGYSGLGWIEIDDGNVFPLQITELASADGLAIGNYYAGTSAVDTDPRDEIIVVDGHSPSLPEKGRATIYRFHDDTSTFTQYTAFATDFASGDGFAVGSMVAESAPDNDELVVANTDGTIQVLDPHLPEVWDSPFESGDMFCVANVMDDDLDEVIIGDISANIIYVYAGDGTLLASQTVTDLASSDEMAVGDVREDEYAEIVIADDSEDQIRIYKVTSGDDIDEVAAFDFYFHSNDELAVAEFYGVAKEEIIVVRGGDNDHHMRGHAEIISFLDGDMPGDRHGLDTLLASDGDWTEKLCDDYESNGYLLIVGEIEIIPAFTANFDHGRIDYTDNQYANTSGDMKSPELSAGRIIGNSVERLLQPIQASIDIINGDVDFDQSNGLVVSGRNSGPGGGSTWINFTLERWDITDAMEAKGYSVSGQEDPSESQFFTAAQNKDVIHLAGHGSEYSWDVIDYNEVENDFDPVDCQPLVYCNGCLTGRYPEGSRTMAESFIRNGASAYIGATEVSYGPYCKYLAEGFWNRFDIGEPAGKALKGAKRNRMGDGDYAKHNSAIFHLFGDPKLEPVNLGLAMAKAENNILADTDPVIPGPLSSITVNVPSFDITTIDGNDYVSIPGGSEYLEVGWPELPSYTVYISFPPAYQVRNVTLSEKGNMSVKDGLNIPLVEPAVVSLNTLQIQQPPQQQQWWPQTDFDWQIIPDSNYGTLLAIDIHPFLYNSLTAEGRFYQNYQFSIDYVSAGIELTMVQTEKPLYAVGEPALTNIYFYNSLQSPTTILLEAVLKDNEDQFIRGAPIRKLTNVEGLGSYSVQWSTSGLEPNDYKVDVTLKNSSGALLDNLSCSFTVGKSLCLMTSLIVTPDCFQANQGVLISAKYINEGDMAASGKIIINIRDRQGNNLTSFEQEFTGLIPQAENTFAHNWAATVPTGNCIISAYVQFEGQTSAPLIYPSAFAPANGDIDGDGTTDFSDFALLSLYWLAYDERADLAPAGGDCIVDVRDLSEFTEWWLTY